MSIAPMSTSEMRNAREMIMEDIEMRHVVAYEMWLPLDLGPLASQEKWLMPSSGKWPS